MGKTEYQYNFSAQQPSSMYDGAMRTKKAGKTLAVLRDYLGDLSALSLLDIGCSAGFMTRLYGENCAHVVGVDIDRAALEYAAKNNAAANVRYFERDGMDTGFGNEAFNIVICTQVYEHVPDSGRLIAEIHRLLKPGGVCYFGACNRLSLIDPEYNLPLLSVIPRPLARRFLRLLGRGDNYYEKFLSLRGLKKLVAQFDIIDYTGKIIEDPEKYSATEMIRQGSLKQKLALAVFNVSYTLCPAYIWLLRKKGK